MRIRLSRWQMWLVIVVGTVISCGLLYFSEKPSDSALIEPVSRTTRNSKDGRNNTDNSKVVDIALNLSKAMEQPVRANLSQAPASNLFASNDWTPPPPPRPAAPPPPPPPPPTAPPLPYSFIGMLEDQVKPTAFLSRDEQLLLVTAGDTLDGTYHVDSISGKEIAFTYLPLKQRQFLSISEAR
jgi:hypothetical protein